MLNLVSPNDLIQVITGSAAPVFVHADFEDLNTTGLNASQNSYITTAATTTVVSPPAAASGPGTSAGYTTRAVKNLTIYNAGASSNAITIQLVNAVPSTITLFTYTLLAGEAIVYGEEQFTVVSATGLIKSVTAVNAVAAGSTGQVQFNGNPYLAGDSNLFWDNTNKRLGIGNSNPGDSLDVVGTVGFSNSNVELLTLHGTSSGLFHGAILVLQDDATTLNQNATWIIHDIADVAPVGTYSELQIQQRDNNGAYVQTIAGYDYFSASWTFFGGFKLNQLIASYNAIATVSNGVPTEYAKSDLTAQSAAQSAVQLYAVPASGAGMYRITWSAKLTTPATTSCVLGGAAGFQIGYTDNDDSVVVTTPAWWGGGNNGAAPTSASTNTTQNQLSGEIIVNAKASTNITFSFGYTSSGATAMQYSIHVKLEAM